MKIDIIGAGIGGLTTAIALKQARIDATVYEQAAKIKPMGAGIILANNAMQVYQNLGLKDEIEARGQHVSSINITKPNFKPISKVRLKSFEQRYSARNIAIHRGALQQILVDQLGPDCLKLAHELTNIEYTKKQYELAFKKNPGVLSDILIGADGLNSTVRNFVLPKSMVRKADQICWRGVTEYQLPTHLQHGLFEAWGFGDRIGFVQIGRGKVYWYALKTFRENLEEYSKEHLSEYFSGYHPVIRELVSSTPKDSIHTAEISDLIPIKMWHHKNICLLGDAAHATTPNMGQGACQAIEDAYVLAKCLKLCPKPADAFKHYQKLRLSKAHQVVRTSWRLGKMAHLKNPFSASLRNLIMQLTPDSLNTIQMNKIFKIAEV